MEMIVEKLMWQQNRESTAKTYLSIWHNFNDFLLKLDFMPASWENRTTLFIAYLVDNGYQSSTVKSYVSAIKKMVISDGYKWKDDEVLLSSLVRACKLKNDIMKIRLPIHCSLLEMILFEVQRFYKKKMQPYLETLYKAIFALGYYGLMRVGELTASPHVLKARDVHIGENKDKILLVLFSSKTHDVSSRPQNIKVAANKDVDFYRCRNFCPFKLVCDYKNMRGDYFSDLEEFFIFKDGTPVTAEHARKVLRLTLQKIGFDSSNYDMHSLRIGRATDLIKFGYSVKKVQRM